MADPGRRRLRGGPDVSPRTAAVVAIALGALAVVAATLVGQDPARLDAIVKPPALIRAALVGVAAVLGVTCLARGLTRLSAGTTDVPGLVRGVRYLFLAVAAAQLRPDGCSARRCRSSSRSSSPASMSSRRHSCSSSSGPVPSAAKADFAQGFVPASASTSEASVAVAPSPSRAPTRAASGGSR